MKNATRITVLFLTLLLFFGCSMQSSPQKKPQGGQQQQQVQGNQKEANTQVQTDPSLAAKIQDSAKTVNGVKDCTAVVVNQNISVAIKVSGFDRFRLKSIREEVHQKIQTLGPDYGVFVSSDKKIYNELQKVQKQIKNKKNIQQLPQQVDQINKDMQG